MTQSCGIALERFANIRLRYRHDRSTWSLKSQGVSKSAGCRDFLSQTLHGRLIAENMVRAVVNRRLMLGPRSPPRPPIANRLAPAHDGPPFPFRHDASNLHRDRPIWAIGLQTTRCSKTAPCEMPQICIDVKAQHCLSSATIIIDGLQYCRFPLPPATADWGPGFMSHER